MGSLIVICSWLIPSLLCGASLSPPDSETPQQPIYLLSSSMFLAHRCLPRRSHDVNHQITASDSKVSCLSKPQTQNIPILTCLASRLVLTHHVFALLGVITIHASNRLETLELILSTSTAPSYFQASSSTEVTISQYQV